METRCHSVTRINTANAAADWLKDVDWVECCEQAQVDETLALTDVGGAVDRLCEWAYSMALADGCKLNDAELSAEFLARAVAYKVVYLPHATQELQEDLREQVVRERRLYDPQTSELDDPRIAMCEQALDGDAAAILFCAREIRDSRPVWVPRSAA